MAAMAYGGDGMCDMQRAYAGPHPSQLGNVTG